MVPGDRVRRGQQETDAPIERVGHGVIVAGKAHRTGLCRAGNMYYAEQKRKQNSRLYKHKQAKKYLNRSALSTKLR